MQQKLLHIEACTRLGVLQELESVGDASDACAAALLALRISLIAGFPLQKGYHDRA
jgi:hypothetical protein